MPPAAGRGPGSGWGSRPNCARDQALARRGREPDRVGYIAAGQGRPNTALALLEEAGAIAEASDAQRILRSVEARAGL